MSNYQVAYNATTKVATVQAQGDAPPAGSTVLRTFKHIDAADGLGASNIAETHVLYHHVARILNSHASEQNMQAVRIDVDTTYVAVTGITRTSAATPTIAVAGTHQMVVTVQPNGTASNTALTYASSNPAKATVSASGLVTGVQSGSTVITATSVDGAFTATATVTVS
jgi:uncharacterized protein YjdB